MRAHVHASFFPFLRRDKLNACLGICLITSYPMAMMVLVQSRPRLTGDRQRALTCEFAVSPPPCHVMQKVYRGRQAESVLKDLIRVGDQSRFVAQCTGHDRVPTSFLGIRRFELVIDFETAAMTQIRDIMIIPDDPKDSGRGRGTGTESPTAHPDLDLDPDRDSEDASSSSSSSVVKIIAGKLFDPYTLTLLENQTIRVCRATGRVLDVSPCARPLGTPSPGLSSLDDSDVGEEVIDLSGLTVLPGFVDAHVHLLLRTVFLHPYSETSWEDQLTKESLAERTIRATVHAKRTLLAGFTTVRIGGVSAETGRASMNTFSEEELRALVESAHMYGVKVAAHATNGETIAKLVALGVDSIEHGYDILSRSSIDSDTDANTDERRILRALAQSKTTWVPTLAAYYTLSQGSGDMGPWARAAAAFKAALEEGMENIACGGDTGVFTHGANALEMVLMVRLGADWRKVLRWGTLGGWECVRSMGWEGRRGAGRLARAEAETGWDGDNDVPFGAIRRGFAADVIATCGDVAGDFEGAVSAEGIRFVMKAGRVYKRDGRAVE
ncbi:hypothetical protein J3R83DRAFT_5933 [Lanmaoa asiatica]|nr:hypothetical protein J3R83DRAFT_5933 [Lanmaoa asiatica]